MVLPTLKLWDSSVYSKTLALAGSRATWLQPPGARQALASPPGVAYDVLNTSPQHVMIEFK